jgi:hypothetical protein
MKLASFDRGRLGVVHDDRIIEISDLVPLPAGFWPPVGMVKLIAEFVMRMRWKCAPPIGPIPGASS